MDHGKVIELYLVNGKRNSLVVAELSNWNGIAVKIPRIEVGSCNREEITQAGVYFLFCKEDGEEKECVYIGESDNVKQRLIRHMQDYKAGKEPYYWNTAVIFTSKNLNKTLISYLENRFVEIARASDRYKVLTKKTRQNTVIKESQMAMMEEFAAHVKLLMSALGYDGLYPYIPESPDGETSSKLLLLESGAFVAKGQITAQGFVLMKGAKISKVVANSLRKEQIKTRNKYLESEAVKDYETTKDILFSSPSAAAVFVLGYSVSGPQKWKTEDGTLLKDIEDDIVNS